MTVSYGAFFSLWAAISTGMAAAALLFYAWRERPRPRRRAKLYSCACGGVYEDRRNVPLSPCPRCGALNEAVRR